MQQATAVLNANVWEALLTKALLFVPQLLTGLVLFLVFWIASLVVDRVLTRTMSLRIDRDLAKLLARLTKLSLLIVGAMIALGTVGVDVTSLVAGLGLTGF